jgi:hypothetical protein
MKAPLAVLLVLCRLPHLITFYGVWEIGDFVPYEYMNYRSTATWNFLVFLGLFRMQSDFASTNVGR